MNRGVIALPEGSHKAETVEFYQAAVERSIGFMKAHLDEPLSLKRLSANVAMSAYHFIRVFDEITGTTPHHFLTALRMQRAKDLLLSSQASITDVCLDVGYSSLGTFSRSFRRLVGVSPQAYRSLPSRLSIKEFIHALRKFLSLRARREGPTLEGEVRGLRQPSPHLTFVGTFPDGVPQAFPLSGTVVLGPRKFRINRPAMPEFHLMAASISIPASAAQLAGNGAVTCVASVRIGACRLKAGKITPLCLRPLCPTDPPILLAFPRLLPLPIWFS